jgi:hypothetical protein
MRRLGLVEDKSIKIVDDGQKRVIADRYGKGATIPELAAEYKVGVGTIWRALQPASEAKAA